MDFETFFEQVQLLDDVFSEKREHVGAPGELEPIDQLFGQGGPTNHVSLLKHQHLLVGSGQVVGGNEAIMACTDDDGVINGFLHVWIKKINFNVMSELSNMRLRWCFILLKFAIPSFSLIYSINSTDLTINFAYELLLKSYFYLLHLKRNWNLKRNFM